MGEVYDSSTGQVVSAPDVPEEMVTVRNPTSGEFEQHNRQTASSLIAQGWDVDSPELRNEIALQRQYGEGVGNEASAAALGIARGASFGLSDFVLSRGGLVDSQTLRELEARNPTASIGGEIASFAIPALGAVKMLGAAGKVARVAGAGITGATRVAAGVEGGASALGMALSRGMGLKAGGVVADTLSHYAPRALGIAAESELYQIGHNLSQAVLKDEPLTAEALLAHSDNALLLGGGLGLVSPLAMRAGRAAVDRVAPELAKQVGAVMKKGVNSAAKKVSDFFDPDNSLQLFSGLKGNTPPRFGKSVRDLRDAGFYRPGEVKFDRATGAFTQTKKGALPDRAAAVDRLETALGDLGLAMDDVLTKGEGVKLGANVNRATLSDAKRISGLINDMRSNGTITAAEQDRLASIWADRGGLIAEKNGSLSGLHDLRKGLDAALDWDNAKAMLKPEKLVLTEIRRIVSEKIKEGVGELAEKGLVKKGEWEKLNKLFMNLKDIEKPIKKSIQQANAWVNVGGLRWRDLMLSSAASPVGATIGGVIGGAIDDGDGALIGSAIGGGLGAGAGIVNKLFQTERGLLWRAQLGERLGALSQANNAIVGIGQKIAQSAARIAKTAPVAAAIGTTKTRAPARLEMAFTDEREHQNELRAAKDAQDRYRVMTRKLSQLVADPGRTAERIAASLRGAEHLSPTIRDQIISKQLQVYSFLSSKAPVDPIGQYMINPAHSQYRPADGEIAKWERYVRAAQRPMSILEDLESNEVTPEAAETVRTLYPRLFTAIQSEIVTKVAEAKNPLPYEERVQLGMMFDVPTDPSLAPEFFESLLARFDEQPGGIPEADTSQGAGTVARAGGADKLSIDHDLTRMQQIDQ